MTKRSYIVLAVVCGFIGTVLRIVAYQSTPKKNVPEWIYNLDSIAYALETLWPFLLSIAICKYLPKIRLLHLVKIPASAYCYVGFFDACKELTGLNQIGSWYQTMYFCSLLFLILFYQYHVYIRNTTDD